MSGRRRRISAAVPGDRMSEFAPRISASGSPFSASKSGQRSGIAPVAEASATAFLSRGS